MAGYTEGQNVDEIAEMIRYKKIAGKIRKRRAAAVCLGAAVVFGAVFLANSIRQPVIVAGDCMRYTIEDGSQCTVNRLAYIFEKPMYNDLIIYKSGKETKISRILGLPGDRVEIKGEKISINGRPVEEYIQVPGETELTFILDEEQYYVLPDVPVDVSEGSCCIQLEQVVGRVSADQKGGAVGK
ncbi:signal peptidase I [Murimonas intestini]|uniref:signal peptidase I n=1 Tax=Murimonas intestini TaxID=1337051 RepID=UPI0011DD4EEC|nr:signal peptidase I [Murimonas intestini]